MNSAVPGPIKVSFSFYPADMAALKRQPVELRRLGAAIYRGIFPPSPCGEGRTGQTCSPLGLIVAAPSKATCPFGEYSLAQAAALFNRNEFGLAPPDRPRDLLLAVGPTGTGKTENYPQKNPNMKRAAKAKPKPSLGCWIWSMTDGENTAKYVIKWNAICL